MTISSILLRLSSPARVKIYVWSEHGSAKNIDVEAVMPSVPMQNGGDQAFVHRDQMFKCWQFGKDPQQLMAAHKGAREPSFVGAGLV